jgi:excisionase family DNA binding protein
MQLGHPDRETVTLTEVAARLGIARSTCYELAAAGRLPLPVIALGRRRVVPRSALDRLLAGEHDARPSTDEAA